jgi:hypothetical protein
MSRDCKIVALPFSATVRESLPVARSQRTHLSPFCLSEWSVIAVFGWRLEAKTYISGVLASRAEAGGVAFSLPGFLAPPGGSFSLSAGEFEFCAFACKNRCSPYPNFVRPGMPEPSYEELKTRLAELEKQQGTRRTGSLEFRVGEKGGISVYGLGRFPVTLYYEQWIRLLDSADKLREFMEENKSKLKLKG